MQEIQVWTLIPPATDQLSPRATTVEPVLWSLGATTTELTCCSYWSLRALDPMLCGKRGHCNEKALLGNQSSAAPPRLLSTTGEKPTQQWRLGTAKNKWINLQKKRSQFWHMVQHEWRHHATWSRSIALSWSIWNSQIHRHTWAAGRREWSFCLMGQTFPLGW